MRNDVGLLLSCVALARAPQPPPRGQPLQAPPSPPLPPSDVKPLSRWAYSTLQREITAPPPSPPYSSSPAGRREEGRGFLLQQKLREFLRARLNILNSNDDPLATRAALSEISLMALESTIHNSPRSSWLSGVHPVAFRKACVTGASRSAQGGGSGDYSEQLSGFQPRGTSLALSPAANI